MRLKIKLPEIAEIEKSPLVSQLLVVIEQQASIIGQLNEQIQLLKDEIARLKNQSPRPKIKPSSLEKKTRGKKNPKGKRPGSKKKRKTVTIAIHESIPVEPDNIPKGSCFKGYNDFVVQGLKIESHTVRYRLKTYETPDGKYICAKLPAHLNGRHFSPELICFILYQHHQCCVTQPLLIEQLHELNIDISKGTLNNILIEGKDDFHNEKDRILAEGLKVSAYINVDDTGARHKGKNGYCTYIGNESFSWYESTESKSRINFLKLLRAGYSDVAINMDAIWYMQANKLPQKALAPILENQGMIFAVDSQWNDFLKQNDIVKDRHVQIATEGVLIGSIIEHGISNHMVIVSDDAGQFNVLLHALCWIHANRAIDKIIPFTDEAKKNLDTVKDQVWQLYDGLKAYKENPTPADKKRLSDMFDQIFSQTTASATLNLALKRIYNNKSELMLVLERSDIPLHNNSAENGIRDYVKKRKISGCTHSDLGRKSRDTFTSLKKTCRKLGVSFWQYLIDRIEKRGVIPDLSDIVRHDAFDSG